MHDLVKVLGVGCSVHKWLQSHSLAEKNRNTRECVGDYTLHMLTRMCDFVALARGIALLRFEAERVLAVVHGGNLRG